MVNRNHVYVGHMFSDGRWDSMQSEDIIYTTYNNAGVRIFNIKDQFAPKELASWVPPIPKNPTTRAPTSVRQRLECRHARARVQGLIAVPDHHRTRFTKESGTRRAAHLKTRCAAFLLLSIHNADPAK